MPTFRLALVAECETDAICFGHLLAVTAETGETLDADRLCDLGRLLESLGGLSASLADMKRAAESELQRHTRAIG
ncbi:hypothetical protein GCM10017624_35340 [Azotobacter vinelandii]|nr:hypothetical protein GCM10017624_35340 [Azotobacter vinelandii]